MTLRTITDLDVRNKKVLLRLDLNLPKSQGKFSDLTRLKRTLPTLKYLIEQGAKTVILSHYGQPKGKFRPCLSLAPIVDVLSTELDGKEVKFLLDILSSDASDKINKLAPGDIMLAENIRFHAAEEKNDLEFAKQIAQLGDIYVNEAFSGSHRKHASIVSIPKLMPSAAGFLLTEEIANLNKYLITPEHPILAITGGSKVSTKIRLLASLVQKVNILVIGGAMANTFLKAQEFSIGESLYEPDYIDLAREVIAKAKANNCMLILPYDVITAYDMNETSKCKVTNIAEIHDNEMIFDVGPGFILNILNHLNTARTVIWNGPLGVFEQTPFDIGTSTITRAIAGLTSYNKMISIAGGGDVVSAINAAKLADSFTYISTGGGAFLKWLEGASLPGVEALCREEKVPA